MNGGRADVGCLCVDELLGEERTTSGASRLLELPELAVRRFFCPDGADLLERLQMALYNVRVDCGTPVAAAVGTGCPALMALAEQLPLERLALIEPRFTTGHRRGDFVMGSMSSRFRQLRRLERFARRNLALFAGELLLVCSGGDSGGSWTRGLSRHCRLTRLLIRGEYGDKMYKKREIVLKQAISCFLRTGDLPKSLAENAEMCIIYG